MAANLSSLGADPFLVALGANDCWHSVLESLLQGYACHLLPAPRKATLKTRLMHNGRQVTCFEEQDTSPMGADTQAALLDILPGIIDSFRPEVVILQDYDRGFFSKENIPMLLDLFSAKDIPVCVDPKYRHFSCYQGAALFKPNLAELRKGTGKEIEATEAVETILSTLSHEVKAGNYLVTLSEQGMVYGNESCSGRQATLVKKMQDVSGAGDTVISAAALGLASGWSLKELVRIASVAAAISCENPGIHPVSKEELEDRLSQQSA